MSKKSKSIFLGTYCYIKSPLFFLLEKQRRYLKLKTLSDKSEAAMNLNFINQRTITTIRIYFKAGHYTIEIKY